MDTNTETKQPGCIVCGNPAPLWLGIAAPEGLDNFYLPICKACSESEAGLGEAERFAADQLEKLAERLGILLVGLIAKKQDLSESSAQRLATVQEQEAAR